MPTPDKTDQDKTTRNLRLLREGEPSALFEGEPPSKKHPPKVHEPPWPGSWHSVEHAAEILDCRPDALRRRIERACKRASDGVMEAEIDGLRARKIGRSWRVSFGLRWIGGEVPTGTAYAADLARSSKGASHGRS